MPPTSIPPTKYGPNTDNSTTIDAEPTNTSATHCARLKLQYSYSAAAASYNNIPPLDGEDAATCNDNTRTNECLQRQTNILREAMTKCYSGSPIHTHTTRTHTCMRTHTVVPGRPVTNMEISKAYVLLFIPVLRTYEPTLSTSLDGCKQQPASVTLL